MIKKVGMIILMESDLEKAVEFFKKLGFSLKFHLKDKWAEFIIDDIQIGLCPTGSDPVDRHTGIVLEVDDMSKTTEELEKESVEFIRKPFEAVHGVMASIKSPGGNILDLYKPTPEKVSELVKTVKQEKDEN